MATWVGLVGVLAGALIAFGSQYLVSKTERQERTTETLLEQCATIIALSEDFRDRIWQERQHLAVNVVKWDLGAYRLAEARLRVLHHEPEFLAALKELRDAVGELDRSWRQEPCDESIVDSAWAAHRDKINLFVAVSSEAFGSRSTRTTLAKRSRTKQLTLGNGRS